MLGIVGTSLATVWERVAYTGLLDFSTDYRTTALFWEMHVGGAAIDGALALMIPFAVHELLVARIGWRWAVAVFATLLSAYACLSTFSRAVYLAIPVSVGVLLWLRISLHRRTAVSQANHETSGTFGPGLLLVVGFAAAAGWMFPASGYRGLLALLGVFAVLMPLVDLTRHFRPAHWLLGLGFGAILSGSAVASAWAFPRSAYASYALAGVFTVTMLASQRPRWKDAPSQLLVDGGVQLALAGFVAMLVGMVLIGLRWGSWPGLSRALPVSATLLGILVGLSLRRARSWPSSLRWQGTVLCAMVLVTTVVGVFGGGRYMADRFAGDTKNLGGRVANWRLGLAMLDSPFDWAFGKGLGRFPANYALIKIGTAERPGDYRLSGAPSDQHLVMSAGTHPLGWLGILRFSQRVTTDQIPMSVRFDVRAGGVEFLLLFFGANLLVGFVNARLAASQFFFEGFRRFLFNLDNTAGCIRINADFNSKFFRGIDGLDRFLRIRRKRFSLDYS
ncbi:MAG: hypothetical protein ABI748_11155, partial [Dokdonella sp.]